MHQVILFFATSGSSKVIWCCPIICRLQMVSVFGRRLGSNFPLMFRVSIWILFLGFVSTMIVLFVFCGLTISDVLASIVGLLSAGWSLLLVSHLQPASKIVLWSADLFYQNTANMIFSFFSQDWSSMQTPAKESGILGLHQGSSKGLW